MLDEFLGHFSEAMTIMIAAKMDMMVAGILQPFKACALGKAKKENVSKTANK